MACRVGNFAKQMGLPVSYCSYDQHDTPGVWQEWDGEVVRGVRNFKRWATRCSHIIWFDVHRNRLAKAEGWGLHNTLVPLIHRVAHNSYKHLHLFDVIACPTNMTWKMLSNGGVDRAANMGWDPGLDFERKSGMFCENTKRLLVVPEPPLSDEEGLMLAYTLRALCDGDPSIEVTILQDRQWPRSVNKAMLHLASVHCCRVNILRKPSHAALLYAYKVHDWVLYAATKISVGTRITEALACGTPVITFNVPPVTEILTHGVNSELVSCNTYKGFLGLPSVEPNAKYLLKALEQTVGNPIQWHLLNAESWQDGLQDAKERFEGFWKQCWCRC